MEVTKREIIVSILIVLLYFVICIPSHIAIKNTYIGKTDDLQRAIVIDTEDLFNHAKSTNKGLAFSYAKLEMVDAVAVSELKQNNFLYIKKNVEEYRPHTETYTTTENGKTVTKTRVVHRWDFIESSVVVSKKIKINNIEVDFSDVEISPRLITDIDNYYTGQQVDGRDITSASGEYLKSENLFSLFAYNRRWYYEVVTLDDLYESGNTSVLLSFNNKTINPADSSATNHKYKLGKMQPSEFKEYCIDGVKPTLPLILLWAITGVIFIGLIIGFYYLDNKWLNGGSTK